MTLKTEPGHFGQKIKMLHILHKIAYLDLEHPKKPTEEVLSDAVTLKTKLGHFGRKIKILHILHKITYIDTELQNNQ